MADDKTKTGSPDSDLINTSEDYEVEYWSKKFGVSAEELKNSGESRRQFRSGSAEKAE